MTERNTAGGSDESLTRLGRFLSGVFQWMFVGLMLFFAWHITPCSVPPLMLVMFLFWLALRNRD